MMTDYKELYLLYCANLCADSNDYTTKEGVKRHNAAMKQLSNCFIKSKMSRTNHFC